MRCAMGEGAHQVGAYHVIRVGARDNRSSSGQI